LNTQETSNGRMCHYIFDTSSLPLLYN